ncbi:uncharacterized protein LOC119110220 [Pollicipes pollicipes]|uniref:uncharacterized protein LOC119110220 n=1 Tax=Pollicipes pollicipes TaxID=41117 RepID=UPI0018851854|nr:uncharacterized protein LOC119110220 [Pollicipes pollicipes]
MHKLLIFSFLCAACAAAAEVTDSAMDELDPRFLFINTTNLVPLSSSALLAGLGSLVMLVLFGLLIWLVISLVIPKFDDGYDSYGSYGGYSGSSHSGYQARSADPYSAIWDNLSVLDWIAMMEELYRKFDATKMECQQRLVCELHQNENTWGTTARKMNDAFGYLQYLELLNLPADLRTVLDQYLEAANKGRTSQKSCEDMYAGCEFSMKTLINKYNGSNSI